MSHKMIATYFFGGWELDSTEVPEHDVVKLRSQTFFCPTCGQIWARVVINGAEWSCKEQPCQLHPDLSGWDRIHGSMASSRSFEMAWPGDWAITLEYLPRKILQREFELSLKQGALDGSATIKAPSGVEDPAVRGVGHREDLFYGDTSGLVSGQREGDVCPVHREQS